LKSQVTKVREEKTILEKQLYDTEFIVGEKDRELVKVKEEWATEKTRLNEDLKDLQDKIKFFREN